MDKEDYTGSERNGMLNGPVPDVDTLEIGITKKEMGELLNCMKQNNIFILFFTVLFTTVLKTIKVYSGCRLCFLMIEYYYIKNGSFCTEGRIMHLCVNTHKYRVYL